jgi:hypothetical protein
MSWRSEDLTFEVGGLSAGRADRIAVAGTVGPVPGADAPTPAEPSRFRLELASGYVPCAGSRLQLMTWGRRVRDGSERDELVLPGFPAGVTVRLEERHDGLVALVAGTPSGGTACTDAKGSRLVSGWFVDGLGRPARTDQLTSFGDRAATTTGRRSAARELLTGEAARLRFVDVELRRILGRPASLAAQRSWTAALAKGRVPDELRAEAYAGTAFIVASGGTPDGWVRGFYERELGRAPSSDELAAMTAAIRAGHRRADLARLVLAGREADDAVARRSTALWWPRPATAAERSMWVTRYQQGPELTVTADLAAASPIA